MDDLEFVEKRNTCLSQMVPNKNELFCPPIFDDLQLCWNYTKAGSTTFQNCPDLPGFSNTAMASKICEVNGSWYFERALNRTWTNFEPCVRSVTDINTVYIFFAGYSLSAICLSASLFIFCYYKQLQCERVLIHKNLFACYLINALVWVMFLAMISKPTVLVDNPEYCQFTFILVTFFSVSTYFWTFAEGLYLTAVLVMALPQGSKLIFYLCIFSGWGFPFILITLYSVLRYIFEKPKKCWTTKTKMQLILTIPNTLALLANLVIVIVILKILVKKLWHPLNREQRHWKKTARAILILFPVLGIQNFLSFISSDDNKVAIVQEFITAILSSLQGVVVSFILCFCNNEVRKAIAGSNNHQFHISRNISHRSTKRSNSNITFLGKSLQRQKK